MWVKALNFLGKYLVGYLVDVGIAYIKYKLEERKALKRAKTKIKEIKKNEKDAKQRAARLRDFLNE